MNDLKTAMLFAVLTALFMAVGGLVGGVYGAGIALVVAVAMNFGAYWYSDKMVLRMYNAQEVGERNAPEIYGIVRELARRENLPMPKVYIIPEATPNAFATGRNPRNAAVAVTEGILGILNREELAGVLAHELGHIKNRDILISTVAGTFAGAISMLANFAYFIPFGGSDDDDGVNPFAALLGVMFAPFAAMLIQTAISRSREHGADAAGARACGNPLALASALRKLENYGKQIPMRGGDPATAHMFIVNPFFGGVGRLFSTHPATEERVARLEAIARQMPGARAVVR